MLHLTGKHHCTLRRTSRGRFPDQGVAWELNFREWNEEYRTPDDIIMMFGSGKVASCSQKKQCGLAALARYSEMGGVLTVCFAFLFSHKGRTSMAEHHLNQIVQYWLLNTRNRPTTEHAMSFLSTWWQQAQSAVLGITLPQFLNLLAHPFQQTDRRL